MIKSQQRNVVRKTCNLTYRIHDWNVHNLSKTCTHREKIHPEETDKYFHRKNNKFIFYIGFANLLIKDYSPTKTRQRNRFALIYKKRRSSPTIVWTYKEVKRTLIMEQPLLSQHAYSRLLQKTYSLLYYRLQCNHCRFQLIGWSRASTLKYKNKKEKILRKKLNWHTIKVTFDKH